MHGFLLQDWTTIRVTGTNGPVVQAEHGWLDLEGFSDVFFWLEISNVVSIGAIVPILVYETSPLPDDSYFAAIGIEPFLAASATPIISKVPSTAAVPLDAWVRWKLLFPGSPVAEWGGTFRIHCAANPITVNP